MLVAGGGAKHGGWSLPWVKGGERQQYWLLASVHPLSLDSQHRSATTAHLTIATSPALVPWYLPSVLSPRTACCGGFGQQSLFHWTRPSPQDSKLKALTPS